MLTDSGTEQAKGHRSPSGRASKDRAPAALENTGRADAPPAFPFRVFPVCCLLSACFLFFSLL
ncbi:hypothetical protein IE992_30040 [Klebsiella pneumoniae]|uniref:Uncharacterized protein n=1 Tax=Klebsiella pneumoniae TaxID=573 RepID=A0A927HVR9_KLEPN|nr:hypothetical protein [Klebsiella pneumoniae]